MHSISTSILYTNQTNHVYNASHTNLLIIYVAIRGGGYLDIPKNKLWFSYSVSEKLCFVLKGSDKLCIHVGGPKIDYFNEITLSKISLPPARHINCESLKKIRQTPILTHPWKAFSLPVLLLLILWYVSRYSAIACLSCCCSTGTSTSTDWWHLSGTAAE